jgi:ABC-2 type transport system permease protein
VTVTVASQAGRLVVIGSAEFLDDAILGVSQRLSQDRYLLNLQLLQNAVDWSVEEPDLLTIRSRGTYTRLLKSLQPGQERFWEVANYAVALLGVVAIGAVWSLRRRSEVAMAMVDKTGGRG